MSGPLTFQEMALGANPYVSKLGSQGGSKSSGLTIQPIQQYQGKNGSVQNPAPSAPTLGTGIANAVSNVPNQIQQMQKLMQWRNQINGGQGGLFGSGGGSDSLLTPSALPADSTAGQGAYGTVGGLDSGTASAGASGSLGTAPAASGGGMSMSQMSGIGSAIGSSIAKPIEEAGQQEQKIASSLKPDINVPQVMYPIPQVGGGGLVV